MDTDSDFPEEAVAPLPKLGRDLELDVAQVEALRESLVERVSTANVMTQAGPATAITYKTPWDPMHHLAVVFGDIRDGRNIAARLQIESVLDDVFGTSDTLRKSMQVDIVEERL